MQCKTMHNIARICVILHKIVIRFLAVYMVTWTKWLTKQLIQREEDQRTIVVLSQILLEVASRFKALDNIGVDATQPSRGLYFYYTFFFHGQCGLHAHNLYM